MRGRFFAARGGAPGLGNYQGWNAGLGAPIILLTDDTPTTSIASAGWLEALAESDADLATGRIVSGDVVLRDLKDSLARLEAKAAARPAREGERQR